MYNDYFGFHRQPFAINPDPRFLYLSAKHQEAIAHLLYGLGEGGGFVMLSGEVGTGKTTLCFSLLDQLQENVDVALILNPRLSGPELLATLCDELHIDYPLRCESPKILVDRLNAFLLGNHACGRRTVVVIDEAQNLSVEVLEQVRLLTNLETPTTKLLQIVLVGQPELQRLLARPELRQVDQRITARYHLRPLAAGETQAYIAHRLKLSGGRPDLFTRRARRAVFRYSKGIPRLINVICDRALLGAYSLEKHCVDGAIVRRAAREVGSPRAFDSGSRWRLLPAGLLVSLGAAALWLGIELGEFPARGKVSISAIPGSAKSLASTASEAIASPIAAPVTGATPPSSQSLRPDFAGWIDRPGFDEMHGLGQLVRRWRSAQTAVTADCRSVYVLGLRCLYRQTHWAALRRLNLPAVLVFPLGHDAKRYAAVIGADDERVRLVDAAGQVFDFPLREVLARWNGQAVLLWEPPSGRSVLTRGMSNPSVIWLRQHLDPAGSPPQGADERFDEGLKARLAEFQSSEGLLADGVAGPETLALLSGARPDPTTPSLRMDVP